MAALTPSAPQSGLPAGKDQDRTGEKGPRASTDAADAMPGRSDQPARGGDAPSAAQKPMRPGDQAPEGTPGTGETVCPRCGGGGRLGASDCPECQGTGKVTVGIGGG